MSLPQWAIDKIKNPSLRDYLLSSIGSCNITLVKHIMENNVISLKLRREAYGISVIIGDKTMSRFIMTDELKNELKNNSFNQYVTWYDKPITPTSCNRHNIRLMLQNYEEEKQELEQKLKCQLNDAHVKRVLNKKIKTLLFIRRYLHEKQRMFIQKRYFTNTQIYIKCP